MVQNELVIEVACATPDKQVITELKVAPGTSVSRAIELSQIAGEFPDLDIDSCQVGIYGYVVPRDRELVMGDRVEIYRELLVEPRQARRLRADQAKRKGKKTR